MLGIYCVSVPNQRSCGATGRGGHDLESEPQRRDPGHRHGGHYDRRRCVAISPRRRFGHTDRDRNLCRPFDSDQGARRYQGILCKGGD